MDYVVLSEELYIKLIRELRRSRRLTALTIFGVALYYICKKACSAEELRLENEKLTKEISKLKREKGDYIS